MLRLIESANALRAKAAQRTIHASPSEPDRLQFAIQLEDNLNPSNPFESPDATAPGESNDDQIPRVDASSISTMAAVAPFFVSFVPTLAYCLWLLRPQDGDLSALLMIPLLLVLHLISVPSTFFLLALSRSSPVRGKLTWSYVVSRSVTAITLAAWIVILAFSLFAVARLTLGIGIFGP